jgi:hypothetical protein
VLRRARAALAILSGVLLVGVPTACGDDDAASPPPSTTTPPRATTTLPATPPAQLRAAIDRSVAWAAPRLPEGDPHVVITYDFLSRAFAIDAFRDARSLATAKNAGNAATDPSYRLFDPAAPLDPALLDWGSPPTRLLPLALACDNPGLPPGTDEFFAAQARDGGYALTHVGLALEVMRQAGCDVPWAAAMRRTALDALTVAARERERSGKPIDDLAIEQYVVLEYLGEESAVTPANVTEVVRSQQPDGSFGGDDVHNALHSVSLAIWLFEMQLGAPGAPYVAPCDPPCS